MVMQLEKKIKNRLRFFSFYGILHVRKKEDKYVTNAETGSREGLALYGLKKVSRTWLLSTYNVGSPT